MVCKTWFEGMNPVGRHKAVCIGGFMVYALITTGLSEMFDVGIFGIIVCAFTVGLGIMIAVSSFKDNDS